MSNFQPTELQCFQVWICSIEHERRTDLAKGMFIHEVKVFRIFPFDVHAEYSHGAFRAVVTDVHGMYYDDFVSERVEPVLKGVTELAQSVWN